MGALSYFVEIPEWWGGVGGDGLPVPYKYENSREVGGY